MDYVRLSKQLITFLLQVKLLIQHILLAILDVDEPLVNLQLISLNHQDNEIYQANLKFRMILFKSQY